MNVTNKVELPGLLPFTTGQRSSFFGRKRQVDDLLSIMQSSKCIALVAQAGTGKTSLVMAGLIPALEQGFSGIAGKQWAIAYCRTGLTPIENLAAALSAEHVLSDNGKSSLEQQEEITRQLRRDHSGLLRVVGESGIAGKKNLLIVLDQFEDVFQFAEHGKSRNEHWDLDVSLLVNNIARAVAAASAPVYVMIILRASYLPGMYRFRSLQEYLNAGLYTLPLLRQEDIRLVIRETFRMNDLKADDAVVNFLEQGYDQNAHHLPFLQWSIQKMVKCRKGNGTTEPLNQLDSGIRSETLAEVSEDIITQKDIDILGDITRGVPAELDMFYLSLPGYDQVLMRDVFRLLTKPGVIPDIRQPQTFLHLLEVTEVSREDLRKFLIELERFMPALLDFIQPFGKDLHPIREEEIRDDTLINIANPYLLRHWERLHQWIAEERESRDTYLTLSERALLYEQGKAGYLVPPDLEVIDQWFIRERPKKVWADQFNTLYPLAIQYLTQSKDAYRLMLDQKELERKREIQRIKKQRFYVLVFAGFMAMVMLYAFQEKLKAEKAEEDARHSLELANFEQARAKKAAKAASDSALAARKQRLIAVAEASNAEIARIEAVRLQEESKRKEEQVSILNGNLQTRISEVQEQRRIARENEDRATENKKRADANARMANDSRDYIAARSRIVTLLNRLNAESFLTPESRNSFTDTLIRLYGDYEQVSMRVHGKLKPFNELYQLLSRAEWKVQEGKSSVAASRRKVHSQRSGLRDIDVYDGKMAVAAGDDKTLVFLQADGGIKTYPTVLNQHRIRQVRFTEPGTVVFSNVNGELYVHRQNAVNPKEREVKLATLDEKIPVSLVVHSNKVFSVSNGYITVSDIKSGNSKKLTAPQGVRQMLELSDGSILLTTTGQLFLFNPVTESSIPLTVPSSISVRQLSAAASTSDYLFLGTVDGKILVCSPMSGNNINLLQTFSAHKTRLTAMLVDREAKQLITASMDNTARIYDISRDLSEGWEETALTLEGFSKWIWDLDLIQNNGTNMLLSVDEAGGMFQWNTRIEDLFDQLKQKKNKLNQ